jgi:excisionase family DNA binding protein
MVANVSREGAVNAHLDDLFAGLPALMTVRDTADLLGMTTNGVYKWVRSGTIPAYKLGMTWFIPRDALKDALDRGSNRTAGIEEPTHERDEAS